MKQDFLKEFVTQIFEHQEQKNAEEKRKNHFRDIGRKGGLARKNTPLFSKLISVRLTPEEYQKVNENAQRLNLKLSKYVRLILTEKELKINEFKTDEVLLSYGNHFKRISNLLRNREFSNLENKNEILQEIKNTTDLIYNYLYQDKIRDE
ncbi:special sigma factor [Capnocytophaga cynodegmi]|uniref:Special sigma factor n=1 Tax=Capnocytophaga cynodegmi TaxID=28189 RepID=A0A250EBP9_9FLAO|nr:special sigma factor [Capnocytophaga cynodegmi]ATA69185.1 special sigma factor [Capnocytophaga cynodegmi]